MKNIRLIDVPAGKTYDLTSIVKNALKEDERVMDTGDMFWISVGRIGQGADIEPGKGLSLEGGKGKTEEQQIEIVKASRAIQTVSGNHATIHYAWENSREGFYIKDHSRNGTYIDGEKLLPGELGYLRPGAELTLGSYGSVRVEEFRNSGEFPA